VLLAAPRPGVEVALNRLPWLRSMRALPLLSVFAVLRLFAGRQDLAALA